MEKKCPHCNGTGKVSSSVFSELVEKAGLSQKEVAELLGVGQGQTSRLLRAGEMWWRGINMRTYGNLDRLAKRLGVTRHQLTGSEPLAEAKPPRPHKPAPAAKIRASKRNRAAVAAKNRRR